MRPLIHESAKTALGNSAANELVKACWDDGRILERKEFSEEFGKALLLLLSFLTITEKDILRWRLKEPVMTRN